MEREIKDLKAKLRSKKCRDGAKDSSSKLEKEANNKENNLVDLAKLVDDVVDERSRDRIKSQLYRYDPNLCKDLTSILEIIEALIKQSK